MAVKVFLLVGVPGSGKTTVVKKIKSRINTRPKEFSHGLCKGVEYGGLKIFGVFDGSKFEGTDKLSMCCISDCIDYIKELEQKQGKNVVFVEGDRLFNRRFVEETGASVYVLSVEEELLQARRIGRNVSQNVQFQKSRKTKIENFMRDRKVVLLQNNSFGDSENVAAFFWNSFESFLHS